MIVGVPRESFPGERRVALVPGGDSEPPEGRARGRRGSRRRGRGGLSRRRIHRARARRSSPDARRGLRDRGHRRPGALSRLERQDRQGRPPPAPPRPGADRLPAAAGIDRDHPGDRRPGRHVVFGRAHAADDPRAEHGRALLDGDDRRLQGRRHRRRHAAPPVPDADHGGGHDHAGAGPGDRGRRGRAPGDRHGAAAGRRRLGLRPAAGLQGTGPEPGRPLRRAAPRGQGRPGRPRLRARSGRNVLRAPARAARAGRRRERRRHHGRGDPGQEVAGAGDRARWSSGWRPAR